MFAYSGALQQLERHAYNLYQKPMCLYGDPAYPLRAHLQGPFTNPTHYQPRYNKAITLSLVAVEYVFGDISNVFAFIDLKKTSQNGVSSAGDMNICCALIQNARSCLYGCTTSKLFALDISMSQFNGLFSVTK